MVYFDCVTDILKKKAEGRGKYIRFDVELNSTTY